MKFDLANAVEVLERTPNVLSALLSDLSQDWTDRKEGEDTFSPRDVVGHLLHGEETDWIPRVERILEHGTDVPFEPFDRFVFREKYASRSLADLLQAFRDAREKSLVRLERFAIDDKALEREGRHPALGHVTLQQLLATWVVHDLSHVRQIARVMCKQYGDDVGPWREYLRVLEE